MILRNTVPHISAVLMVGLLTGSVRADEPSIGSVITLRNSAELQNTVQDSLAAEELFQEARRLSIALAEAEMAKGAQIGRFVTDGFADPYYYDLGLAISRSNMGYIGRADDLLSILENTNARNLENTFFYHIVAAQHQLSLGRPDQALSHTRKALGQFSQIIPTASGRSGASGTVLTEISPQDALRVNAQNLNSATYFDPHINQNVMTAARHAHANFIHSVALRRAEGPSDTSDAVLADALDLLDGTDNSLTGWLKAEILREKARRDPTRALDYLRGALAANTATTGQFRQEIKTRFEYANALALAGQITRRDEQYRLADKLIQDTDTEVSLGVVLSYLEALNARPRSPQTDAQLLQTVSRIQSLGVAKTTEKLLSRLAVSDPAQSAALREQQDLLRRKQQYFAEFETATRLGQQNRAQVSRAQLASVESALDALGEILPGQLRELGPSGGVNLSDLRAALKDDEVFISLQVDGANGFVVATSQSDFIAYSLRGKGTEIAETVRQYRRMLDGVEINGQDVADPFDPMVPYHLYKILFQPELTTLIEKSSTKHLLIQTTGPLLDMTPAVLLMSQPTPEMVQGGHFAQGRWLGIEKAISVIFDPGNIIGFRSREVQTRKEDRKPIAVFGRFSEYRPEDWAPLFDRSTRTRKQRCAAGVATTLSYEDARLPGADREVTCRENMISGEGGLFVTKEDFRDDAIFEFGTNPDSPYALGNFNVLHFATHGIVSSNDEECAPEPALLTNVPAPSIVANDALYQRQDRLGDGWLDLGEIAALKLDAALIVLSACETGAGAETISSGIATRGEGYDGLVRAFIFAGARSLLSSHWIVDDEIGSQFMEIFYLGLADGNSIAESVRLARAHIITTSDTAAEPYYWGGFSLAGDGASRIDGLTRGG